MKAPTGLSGAGRAYVAAVACAGTLVVGHSIAQLASHRLGFQWFVLAGLTLLSGSFTVRVPGIPARLSVSETFVFAAAMLFGPAAAAVLVVLDSLVISLWQPQSSRRPLRVLFNMSAPAVAIWVAAHTFFRFANIPPLYNSPRQVLSLLVPLLAMAVVYFFLNSWLIAWAVGFEKRTSALIVWQKSFLWLSLNFFSGASVAALLLPYLQDAEQSFFRVTGILLPLLLISYLTYKTALGRVDDANRHLDQLNQLYLSTIETLAMAIDAKDQITHGHIRRVQHYAVELARLVGVTDPAQISAIEAASLLHDMGKLAVPEYILNKPGKLTPAEFERMKLHASVGADILSSISFPYPVVPIVRHHHENWDGTGYPEGLKGSAIPIGARILSVVDCFDALTSDRPYRPKLTDSEALRILTERRGSMYDPLIVDAFIGHYREITKEEGAPEAQLAERLARPAAEERMLLPDPLENITASSEEMLVLYDLARNLAGVRSDNATDVLYRHIRRMMPLCACVFFRYDSAADSLTAVQVAGENAQHFLGIRIPRGQRLSGWVAANKQTILNSDPVLDLGDVARSARPRLRSCLSTPVLSQGRLVGVLSVYSAHDDAFGEDHRRVIEGASRQLAGILEAAGNSSDQHNVRLIGSAAEELPDERALQAAFDAFTQRGPVLLLFIEVAGHHLEESASPTRLDSIAGTVRRHIPDPNLVFRYGSGGLVVALPSTDAALGSQIALDIARRLNTAEVLGSPASITVSVGFAGVPDDGLTLEDAVSRARFRRQAISNRNVRTPSVH